MTLRSSFKFRSWQVYQRNLATMARSTRSLHQRLTKNDEWLVDTTPKCPKSKNEIGQHMKSVTLDIRVMETKDKLPLVSQMD